MAHHPPLQVVDEEDRPVGGASMPEAYENGLIHRVVYVFVEDEQGRILLQKRGPSVANYPNRWDISAGGHVDEGEDYLEAAKRELQEEMGISNIELQELAKSRADERLDNKLLKRFKAVYKAKVPNGIGLRPNPEEVSGVQWATPADIKELINNKPDQVASGLSLNFFQHYSV